MYILCAILSKSNVYDVSLFLAMGDCNAFKKVPLELRRHSGRRPSSAGLKSEENLSYSLKKVSLDPKTGLSRSLPATVPAIVISGQPFSCTSRKITSLEVRGQLMGSNQTAVELVDFCPQRFPRIAAQITVYISKEPFLRQEIERSLLHYIWSSGMLTKHPEPADYPRRSRDHLITMVKEVGKKSFENEKPELNRVPTCRLIHTDWRLHWVTERRFCFCMFLQPVNTIRLGLAQGYGLLAKLHHFGVCGQARAWLKSYLSNCRQCI